MHYREDEASAYRYDTSQLSTHGDISINVAPPHYRIYLPSFPECVGQHLTFASCTLATCKGRLQLSMRLKPHGAGRKDSLLGNFL